MLIEHSSEALQFGKFRQLLPVPSQRWFAPIVEFLFERLALGSLTALIVYGGYRVPALTQRMASVLKGAALLRNLTRHSSDPESGVMRRKLP